MRSPWKLFTGLVARGKPEAPEEVVDTGSSTPELSVDKREDESLGLVDDGHEPRSRQAEPKQRASVHVGDVYTADAAPDATPETDPDAVRPEPLSVEASGGFDGQQGISTGNKRISEVALDRAEADRSEKALVGAGQSSVTPTRDVRPLSLKAKNAKPAQQPRPDARATAVELEMEIRYLRSELSQKLRIQNAELSRLLSRYDLHD